MDGKKIFVFSGKSGSGKTYQLKKIANNQYARYFHADELLDMIIHCGEYANTNLASLFLSSGATMFAFDDIDYELEGKTQCQEELCRAIWNLVKHGCRIAMGVVNIEKVPAIKQFLTSSQTAGFVSWEVLYL